MTVLMDFSKTTTLSLELNAMINMVITQSKTQDCVYGCSSSSMKKVSCGVVAFWHRRLSLV